MTVLLVCQSRFSQKEEIVWELERSEWRQIQRGYPQGSNQFGPLIWNIYQNDLVYNIGNSNLNCIFQLWIFVCIKYPYPSNGVGKKNFDYNFSSWCNLRLKFGKITSWFTLTERLEAGNYHINFWSVTSKAEFSSETESPDQFLYICSIYVAPTHLATIFYKKMEQI